jgi:Pyruvate/2-oxoacid:ferredoxin oxidoreductase delta subunit
MRTLRLVPVDALGPLETTRRLLAQIWDRAGLDGMLVPVWIVGKRDPRPTLLANSAMLDRADPFAPLMTSNAAPQAVEIIRRDPERRFGLVLRPCELRSLRRLASRLQVSLGSNMVISTDCLATFPSEDFDWRLKQTSDYERMTEEALHFAAQGGILPSRLRGTCQFCEQPYPVDADIQIETIGLETSKHLVVNMSDERLALRIGLGNGPSGSVPPGLRDRREHVLGRLASWRRQARAFAESHLDAQQSTLPALIAHLQACNSCREWLQAACPLFALNWEASHSGELTEELDTGWLDACGGCGMCEHECPDAFPLPTVIGRLGRWAKVAVV